MNIERNTSLKSIRKSLTSLGGIKFLELLFLYRKEKSIENDLYFKNPSLKGIQMPYNYLLFLGLYAINSPGKKDNIKEDNIYLFKKILMEVEKILESIDDNTIKELININENNFFDIIEKEFQYFQIFSMDKYNVEYVKNCCEKLITQYCKNTEKKFLLKFLNYISKNEELTIILNSEKNFLSKLNNNNFIKIREKFLKNPNIKQIQFPDQLNFSIINLNVLIQNSNKDIIILPNYLSVYIFYLNLFEYLAQYDSALNKKSGTIIENELLSYIEKNTNLPSQPNVKLVDYKGKEHECDLIMESEKFLLIFEIKKGEFSHDILKENFNFYFSLYNNFFAIICKIIDQLLKRKEIITDLRRDFYIEDLKKLDNNTYLENIKKTIDLKNCDKIILTFGITFGDFKFLGKRRYIKNIIKIITSKMLQETKIYVNKINEFERLKNSLGNYMEDFRDIGFIDVYTFLKLCETCKTVDELGENLFFLSYIDYHARNNITNFLALQQDKDKPSFEEFLLDLKEKSQQGIIDMIYDDSTVYHIINKK